MSNREPPLHEPQVVDPAPLSSATPVAVDDLLALADKPQRYVGGERNAYRKPLTAEVVKWALCFPEVYEIGMSHLGLKILYHILNESPGAVADRAYCPWVDMESEMRRRGIPAFAHESRLPLRAFDILGFSLQYELTYGNVLTMLDLAGIPLRARDRRDADPLVLGGGPCMANPEPVADFFDAFLIGDGEEAVLELNRVVRDHRGDRARLLRALARVPGVYVPSLYAVRYHDDGTIAGFETLHPGVPAKVKRVWVEDLSKVPFPANAPVPLLEIVQDRLAIEVVRGCTQGCRFCQAGYWYRPVRERSADQVVALAGAGITSGGWDDVSLVSLSTADHSQVDEMARMVSDAMRKRRVSISLPSLRADSFSVGLAEAAGEVKKNGFTFAPETGSERLRRVINKNITDENLLTAVETAYRRGWNLIKLYFMIGLPTETMEDVDSIVHLVNKVNGVGRRIGGGKRVNASIGTHVPKPFTPFQWEGFESLPSLKAKLAHLRRRLGANRFVRLKWHDLEPSLLEAVFSLGDRRLSQVLEAAWRRGARFDGWGEQWDWERWREAFEEVGIDPSFYTRARDVEEVLPWDLIDAGITKKFLLRERRRALEERLTNDCRWGDCHMCGIPNAPEDIVLSRDRPRAPGIVNQVGLDGNPIWRAGFARRTGSETVTPPPTPPLDTSPLQSEERSLASADRIRVRIWYATGESLRFLAHNDLMRAFHRAFRIAELPVDFSQGFNPRPRAAFGPPLPVGVTGAREAMDVELAAPCSGELLAERLNTALPPGLRVLDVQPSPGGPSLAASVVAAEYRIGLPPGIDGGALSARLAAFEAAESMPVVKERHGRPDRTIDLKRAVREAERRDGQIHLRLAVNEPDGHQASAHLVLEKLFGLDEETIAVARVERVALFDAAGRI